MTKVKRQLAALLLGVAMLTASNAIADDNISDSVVYIYTDKSMVDIHWGRGTGIIVKKFKDGSAWMMTANHVVSVDGDLTGMVADECEEIFLKLSSGQVVKATHITHGGKGTDLALYRLSVCPVPAVEIASEDVVPGDTLFLQGAPHRDAGTRNYKVIANPMTWKNEVFADGECWTGESGTALLNDKGELVSILTGGWRKVQDQDGNIEQKRHPKNPFATTTRVYPIVGMSNANVLREFMKLGASLEVARVKGEKRRELVKTSGDCFMTEYKDGMLDVKDGKKRLFIVSAEWCSPCQKLKREIKRNKDRLKAVGVHQVVIIDGDRNVTAKRKLGARMFPTSYRVSNGNVESSKVGYQTIDTLERFMK